LNISEDVKQAYSVSFELFKTKQKSTLQKLNKVLCKLPGDVVQPLHEVILLALQQILRKENVESDSLILAANCFSHMFKNTRWIKWETKSDILKQLLICITVTENSHIAAKQNEELIDATLHALKCLLNSSIDSWKSFYAYTQLPILGHLVSLCLSILNTPTNNSNKRNAIDMLTTLCVPTFWKELNEAQKSEFSLQVGDCMACFMPGISCTVANIISVKLGKKLRCSCFGLVAVLLSTTLGDKALTAATRQKSHNKLSVDKRILSLVKSRDQAWIDGMSDNLDLALVKILLIKDDDDENVRLCLLDLCRTLLIDCRKSLKMSYTTIMYPILILLNDSVDRVSKASKTVIEDFMGSFQDPSLKLDFMDTVKNELFNLCEELPQKLKKYSEYEKVSTLSLLLGYLTVLKHDLSSVFNSACHVVSLLESMLHCFNYEVLAVCLFGEVELNKINSTEFQCPMDSVEVLETLKNFQRNPTASVLSKVCKILGSYGDIELLVGVLMEKYQTDTKRLAAVAIIKEILLGADKSSNTSEAVIDELLDLYTEDITNRSTGDCELQIINKDHYFSEIAKPYAITFPLNARHPKLVKPLSSNSLLVCLQLQSFAVFSTLLQRTFSHKLIKVLYPFLEKVSHSDHEISQSAVFSLAIISRSCGHISTAELIKSNADYLASTLSLHLQHLPLFPRCPDVLQAILIYNDIRLFPLVRDTVTEILCKFDTTKTNLDTLQSFLRLFVCIIHSIRQWFRSDQKKVEINSLEKPDHQDVLEFIHQCSLKTLETQAPFTEEEISPDNNVEDSADIEEDPCESSDEKPPPDVAVVLEILQRCKNLMAHKDRSTRILVMNAVAEGVEAIAAHENWLLPMVHQLWASLLARFEDTELQVVQKAFEVICCMSSNCGDFIRKRLGKEILPKLVSFLKQQQMKNKMQQGHSYNPVFHSALYKLQLSFLQHLGPLLVQSSLAGINIISVCSSCYGFLSCQQWPKLQEAALSLFSNLINLNKDAVWLFLSDLQTTPPVCQSLSVNSKLENATACERDEASSEYSKNVVILLNDCG
uniref:Uncharacterized protein n=1 Tax=Ciona savignyi TaxID=51511 RepID=H2YGZ3_CIOSA